MNKLKEVIEYDIPIQGEEAVKKHNEMCEKMFGVDRFKPLKSTEEHIDILFEKFYHAIQKVGDDGGWYVGDGIKVKIELEYDYEDK
jgi:hypothetical protein